MYFINQVEQNDCGFACLKIMLANLNHNKNYLYIKPEREHGPYSFSDLVRIGKKYHLNLIGIKSKNKLIDADDIRLPLIASIEPHQMIHHSVVIYKIKNNKVYILDPNKGKVVMGMKKFVSMWDGRMLAIESFTQYDLKLKIEHPLKKTNYVFVALFQLINVLLCISGIYFINEDSYVYISVLLLSLFAISEIILRNYLIKLMDKIDVFYIIRCRINKNNYEKYLLYISDYKRLTFHNILSLILSLVSSIFIIAITLINNLENYLLIVIPIIISLLNAFLFEPILLKKKEKLAVEEKELSYANEANLKKQISLIQLHSYKIARYVLLRKYLVAVLFIFNTLLTMIINSSILLPYIVFYYFVQQLIYDNFTTLLLYKVSVKEANRNKVRLINMCE